MQSSRVFSLFAVTILGLGLIACGKKDGPSFATEECATEVAATTENVTWQGGSCLRSPNSQYALFFRDDGNLELANHGKVVWQSNSGGAATKARHLALQVDSNLLILEGSTVIWNSEHVSPIGQYKLTISDDGDVAVSPISADGSPTTAVWSLAR